ncbi:blastula protease 10-like [Saccostrea echinata]|uniref:blastula protease 10-like n=1 Tax=Saccostrea echinata TaxID=191078 RepID=UPI002A826766|nr:blastula protease 10-like [Saccostrea echinata]
MKIFGCALIFALVFKTESMSIDTAIKNANNNSMAYDLVSSESSRIVRKELDILMTLDDFLAEEKERMEEKNGKRKRRKAIRDERRRWPNNIIPYEIAPSTFSSAALAQINAALDEWRTQTCLTFPLRTSQTAAIRFQNGDGCSSFIGRTGNIQPISLANGCRISRIITHEIGHAVGYWHEQSRPDRDGFVEIQEANIASALLFNFEKQPTSQVNTFGVPYDYLSVMHYGARAFSTNNGITVRTIDQSFQNIIGNAPGLSFSDIKLANLMYNCAASCPAQNCPGEGFVGKDCQCKCPTGDANNPVQNCQGTPVATSTSGLTTTSNSVVTTTTTPPIEAAKVCEDMGNSCTFLRDSGLCSNRFVRRYMETNCAATCEYCEAGQPLGANEQNNASKVGSATLLFALPLVLISILAHMYADDTTQDVSDKSINVIENKLHSDLINTLEWMEKNKLTINL